MATNTVLNVEIPLDQIVRNENQPRKYFDQGALQELADSIVQHGVLQPIVVTPVDGGDYQIIAGERRWRAARLAGLDRIPCRVLDDISAKEAYILSIAENLNRRDFTPLEEAKAFAELVALGSTKEEIAKEFGREPWYIGWRIDLLSLREDLQALVDNGQLNLNLARNISRLSPEGQRKITNKYIAGDFSNPDVASRYAAKELEREQQVELEVFKPVELDPFDAARRETRRASVKSAWESLGKVDLLKQLGAFLELGPEELADALGPDTQVYSERFEELARNVTKVRALLREASAAHLATAAN